MSARSLAVVALALALLPSACSTSSADPAPSAAAPRPTASTSASAAAPMRAPGEPEVRDLIARARGKRDAWEKLRGLTDGVGHRLSGSPALDRAIAWAVQALRDDGHEGVHTERVMVPVWVRGEESLELLGATTRRLAVLGLGGTIATPKGGLEGEIAVVRDWTELERLGAGAKDKIVLFDVAMRPHDDVKGSAYGELAGYRWSAAARAAKLAAKAVLVRSLATASLRSPHTGGMGYEDGVAKIPAASVAVEDAQLLARLVERGEKVRVRLALGAKTLPDAPSANVVAELRGREKPDEVVLLGAHLDSWDVGQGAHDDGAGCVIVMQALTTLRALPRRPRRTVRVVLFTNEENGGRGAKGYAQAHEAELPKHVAALEADLGGFAPDAFRVEVPKERAAAALRFLTGPVRALDDLGPLKLDAGESGADAGQLAARGVPGIGFLTKGTHYFDLHHSEADTLDKVNPLELAESVAAVAGLAWALAESEVSLRGALGKP